MKNTWFWAGICGLCLLFSTSPARAAYLTGNDLLRSCASKDKGDILGCMNYIAAVIDYQTMMQSMGTEPSTDFCLPADLPIEKAAVAVMVYLHKSPQMGSFIAAPAVSMALHEAYPCGPIKVYKKKKKRK